MLLLFNSYWHSSIAFSARCFSPGTTNLDNRKLFVASAIWAWRTWGEKIEVYSARQRRMRQKRISFTPNWIYRILCAVAYHSANSNIRSTQNEMFFGVAHFFPFLCQLNFPTNFSRFVQRQRKIFFCFGCEKIATLIALKFSIDFQMIISSKLFSFRSLHMWTELRFSVANKSNTKNK